MRRLPCFVTEDGGLADPLIADRGVRRTARRILLIDLSPISRECLTYTLGARAKDIAIEGVAQSRDSSMEHPDAILFNIKSARTDEPGPSEAISAIRKRYASARIIILSDLIEASAAMTAIRSGADGYAPTSLSLDILVAVLGLVLAGGIFVPMELLAPHALPPSGGKEATSNVQIPQDQTFTTRELQVVTRLREGKPNKIIAHELDISVSTVKVHIRNVMKKLNASNRTQVALLTASDDQVPARIAGNRHLPSHQVVSRY